jgi:tRNA threonylcarbamoyladenosine biosynthesis protein TsaE
LLHPAAVPPRLLAAVASQFLDPAAATKRMLRVNASAIYNAWVIIVINLPDETATAGLAARLAASAQAGDVFALKGDLGAGKTTLARAFIRARGAAEDVPSPTFTLVQVYETAGAAVWHFDLYRLTTAEEAWELGIEEAFASGIALVEWPERLGSLLPQHCLEITLEFADAPGARRAVVKGGAEWRTRIAEIGANA